MKKDLILLNSFKRDLKKHYLSLATAEWAEVITCLVEGKNLPEKYRDHALTGNLKAFRDCHVKPDLVLLYKIMDDKVELHYLDTHSEVFKKADK